MTENVIIILIIIIPLPWELVWYSNLVLYETLNDIIFAGFNTLKKNVSYANDIYLNMYTNKWRRQYNVIKTY